MKDTTDQIQTIGDAMEDDGHNTAKSVAQGLGILVYIGFVVYSGVHNLQLMTTGVSPDMRIWSYLGVLALEMSAVALPLALHFWCYSAGQRWWAYGFYLVDLGMVFFNVVVNYSSNTGTVSEMPTWLQLYHFYLIPASPVIAGIGWTVLFLLDPSQKTRATVESLKASTITTMARKVATRAKEFDISSQVDLAASKLTGDVVARTLGIKVPGARAPEPARDATPIATATPDASASDSDLIAAVVAEQLSRLLGGQGSPQPMVVNQLTTNSVGEIEPPKSS